MTDPDTPTSVPGDAPSGQDLEPDSTPADAPDPRAVKQQRTDSGASGEHADGDEQGSTPPGGRAGSEAAKDLDQWVTGDEPMTGPQASYLETPAQQAGVEVPTGLTEARDSQAIDDLRARAGR